MYYTIWQKTYPLMYSLYTVLWPCILPGGWNWQCRIHISQWSRVKQVEYRDGKSTTMLEEKRRREVVRGVKMEEEEGWEWVLTPWLAFLPLYLTVDMYKGKREGKRGRRRKRRREGERGREGERWEEREKGGKRGRRGVNKQREN